MCAPCRRLQADIDQLVKKARRTSEATVAARVSIGSNYPLKYLSPTSKADRVSRISKERKNLSAKVSALSPFNFDLKDKRHGELLQFVHTIHKTHSRTIEDLCVKGDEVLGQERNLLRQAWKQDVIERLDFEKDQFKAGKYAIVSALTILCGSDVIIRCFTFFFFFSYFQKG